MLLEAGVDWLGFPLKPELHREDLPAEQVSEIIASFGIGDRAVLITYLGKATEIAGLAASWDAAGFSSTAISRWARCAA